MWPFSNKKKESKPPVPVRQALEQLATLGIRPRPQITHDDLLLSLGGTMDSPEDYVGCYGIFNTTRNRALPLIMRSQDLAAFRVLKLSRHEEPIEPACHRDNEVRFG